jgi:hypothetical protein
MKFCRRCRRAILDGPFDHSRPDDHRHRRGPVHQHPDQPIKETDRENATNSDMLLQANKMIAL